ncbi:MAG: hypothetical protein ACRCW2_05570 [Cellulosilyticaceae bacterium]
MDIKQLDKLAKKQEEMPQGLKGYEQAYYIASRVLYGQYAQGLITIGQARKEKEQVVKVYEEGEREFAYFLKLHEVREQLVRLRQEGFDTMLEFEILETLERLL